MQAEQQDRWVSSGIAGLDHLLGKGLPPKRVYLIGAFDFAQSESQIAWRFKKAPWDCRLWEDIQRPRDISVLDI